MENIPLLTIAQAANYLTISKSEVYKMVANKEIPFIKISHKILRFKKDDLDEWVNSFRQITITEFTNKIEKNIYERINYATRS